MDNLSYTYYPGTNRLSGVTDAVAAGQFAGDVDSQVANNYAYDGSGNLNQDLQSGIARNGIKWSPYGKVLSVNRGSGNLTNFSYDASQNRIRKQQVTATTDTSTYYIRDAQGNVLAVYRQYGTTVAWQEQHLYGSSRLGSLEPGVSWTTAPTATPYFRATPTLRLGWKRYELSDHLGNVRAVINDRRTYNTAGLYYSAAVLNGTDYFPFGSEMRSSRLANYRFGFNGKELDKSQEFGILNAYDYGFRIYNPGIGRFLSVDPLIQKYPELTPYQFASNTPIMAIDLDGLEKAVVITNYKNGFPTTTSITQIFHAGNVVNLDARGNGARYMTTKDILEINLGELPTGEGAVKPYDIRSDYKPEETAILNAGVDAKETFDNKAGADHLSDKAGFTFMGSSPSSGDIYHMKGYLGTWEQYSETTTITSPINSYIKVPFPATKIPGTPLGIDPIGGLVVPNPSERDHYDQLRGLMNLAIGSKVDNIQIDIGMRSISDIPGINLTTLRGRVAENISKQFGYRGKLNVTLTNVKDLGFVRVSSPGGSINKPITTTITKEVPTGKTLNRLKKP